MNKTDLIKSIDFMANFQLVADTVKDWKKKKPLPILDKISNALSSMYIHTVTLESNEWYYNKTIEEYRSDKLRAVERARKAEAKVIELEKELTKYKEVYGE